MMFAFGDEIFVYPEVKCRRPVDCALQDTMFVLSRIFIHVQVPTRLFALNEDHALLQFHLLQILTPYMHIHTHGLQTPREEIAFTHGRNSKIFRYGQSIFCLPHRPKFSDFIDLCLHWVSVVPGLVSVFFYT